MERRSEGTRDIFLKILEEYKPWTETENPLPTDFRERSLIGVRMN